MSDLLPIPRVLLASEIASLSTEHASLAQQQCDALQHSAYMLMAASEAIAYDARRLRISELVNLLAKFSPEET
jgi:hypothetical protein